MVLRKEIWHKEEPATGGWRKQHEGLYYWGDHVKEDKDGPYTWHALQRKCSRIFVEKVNGSRPNGRSRIDRNKA